MKHALEVIGIAMVTCSLALCLVFGLALTVLEVEHRVKRRRAERRRARAHDVELTGVRPS